MHRAAEGGIGGRAWRGPLSTYDSATAERVRRELASVLESADFIVPERARRFLSYIVEESLAGRADRIKAFSIATDVLGRGSSFDGSVDPVVRIEAGRVRRALEHYYLVAGADDPVIITIPKGGYVPIFTRRDINGSSDQVFVDEKPAYYDFANKTHNMTGAEVFAEFGPAQG